MVVQKVFCICIRTFVQAHRIASLWQRIRIAFLHFFRNFAILRPFCSFFFTVNTPKSSRKGKKCERNAEMCQKCEKCGKARNANAMRKRNQNLHCIASHYYGNNFSHFHTFSHRIFIALPSLLNITECMLSFSYLLSIEQLWRHQGLMLLATMAAAEAVFPGVPTLVSCPGRIKTLDTTARTVSSRTSSTLGTTTTSISSSRPYISTRSLLLLLPSSNPTIKADSCPWPARRLRTDLVTSFGP